jgi:hypothetical protein
VKKKCPKCGSKRVAKILYGKPIRDFIEEPLRRGEIVLGGDVPEGNVPSEHCLACGFRWGRIGSEGVHA